MNTLGVGVNESFQPDLLSQAGEEASTGHPGGDPVLEPVAKHFPFKLWNPPPSQIHSPATSAYDLEPTAAEVVAAYQSQVRKTENLRNAPLLTQEIRDRQQKEKYKKWPECTIRIRFHNQMQLEKTFPSTNKIKSVYAFVRDCLNDEAKSIKFVLYQPPTRELKVSDSNVREKTLLELQLAPSSVLLLRFLSDSLNDRDRLPPLHSSVMDIATDFPVIELSTADETNEPQSASKSKQSRSATSKDTDNKISRLLKLQPRK